VSGYFAGAVDNVMMRIADFSIFNTRRYSRYTAYGCVKTDALRIAYSSSSGFAKNFAALGPGVIAIFTAFALFYWVTNARIIRGHVLVLREQEYITAAKALGCGGGRIIRKHIIPNCASQMIVTTCLMIPSAIFLESFLSFLGLGVSAP
jgi:ABC-type dipeptide/oligopeptide/nickel transport system permease subunit